MKRNSFTLIEVMIAVAILTTAVGAAFSLIRQNLVASSINQASLIAAYLGQEGVEIVKNIRDNNWLAGNDWDYGLATGTYRADYNDLSLDDELVDRVLNLDNNGFYSYEQGTQTVYRRTISIEKETSTIKATARVDWSERGTDHSIEIVDYIYDYWARSR